MIHESLCRPYLATASAANERASSRSARCSGDQAKSTALHATERRCDERFEPGGVSAAVEHPGHLALVELEKRDKLQALITQNIDELHQVAGNSSGRVIEVHGSMRRFMCFGCGMRGPMQLVLERVRAGEEDPRCRDCGGILKSDTISFGQQLVPEVIEQAMRAAAEADLFIAVGTSLQVYPVAGTVELARGAGARIVIVNAEPTPFDRVADAVFNESISAVLPQIISSRESAARSLH